jgi:periplasmic divalent cation tolerance protein
MRRGRQAARYGKLVSPSYSGRITRRATNNRSLASLGITGNMPHTDALVVLTTVATEDEAVRLVRALLDRRIIACGTLLPGARSLYRWQGKTADEREVVLMLKTRSGCLDALRTAFGELHPYKVPELLALSVEGGTEKYLEWIAGETSLALT